MGTVVGYVKKPDHWVLRLEPRQRGTEVDLFEVLCPLQDQNGIPYTPVLGEYVAEWVGHVLIDADFNAVEPTPVVLNGKKRSLTTRTFKAYKPA